ncbi:unnamed protein product, partial [marine sediment metagenome]
TGMTPSAPGGEPKAAKEIAAVLAELLEALARQAEAA